jgi:transcriptional regulator of aromatic amino acid metabolism
MPRSPSLKERLDRATLEKLYNQAGLSTVQLAQRFGTSSPQILKLMDEYGIPRRSRGAGKR